VYDGGPPASDDPSNPHGGVVELNADRELYYGVTHVMSLGLDGKAMDIYRREQDAGRMTGALVFFAGYGSSARNGWQTNKGLHRPTTPEEGREAVRTEVARHVDVIKFWVEDDHGKIPKLTPDIYGAIIDEAHGNNLKTFVHLDRLSDAKELLRRGIDVFAHSIRDAEVDDEFLALARQRGVVQIGTLAAHSGALTYLQRPAFLDDPSLAQTFPAGQLAQLASPERQKRAAANPDLPMLRQEYAIAQRNIRKENAAGVTIVLGTDGGGLYGFDDHREMELLAGSPVDRPSLARRLPTATSN
jgi:imidazolonepropionase-like amidohydrolase